MVVVGAFAALVAGGAAGGSLLATKNARAVVPLSLRAPSGPTSCLDVPVSTLVLQPTSCWSTGATSMLVAGIESNRHSDGVVVIANEQKEKSVTVPGGGRLKITGITNGRACVATSAGGLIGVDLGSGTVSSSCAGSISAAPSQPLPIASSNASGQIPHQIGLASGMPPSPTSSFYVYGAYIGACGPTATTACPLFNDGANELVPSTGGMTILDFGAPCYDPNTLAWGTQLINTQSCTPDSELVTLAQAWIRGYETNPSRSTSSSYIVAAGTSNSLTAAVPGFALSAAQMYAHGVAWSDSVVKPIAAGAAGLAAPITVWSGTDTEESSDGNWYDGTTSRQWTEGYASVTTAAKPCVSSTSGLTVDYGDYVPNEPGWTPGDVYHIAWESPPACPVPEIYYTANAGEWQSLNQWAANGKLPLMTFTGVLSENGAVGSLSASGSWSALQGATGQAAPYLSVIGGAASPAAQPPDAPTGVTAVAGAASATVSWSSPAWDGGAKISDYTVTAYTGGNPALTVNLGGWPVPDTTVVHGLANGLPYTFTVTATNLAGSGAPSAPSNAVTPSELLPYTAVSTSQYHLSGSNGTAWTDIDSQALSLTIQPTANAQAVITANADLWTANLGFNQDLGVSVNGTLAAWKESGGSAGTFSPNAATLHAVIPMSAGNSYVVRLQWKANKPAAGATIYAGAGPVAGQYSPTRLSVQLVSAVSDLGSAAVTTQPRLANSDGSSWVAMDPHLALNFQAPAAGTAIITGNADLWTATAGYNQDIGLSVNGSIAAWKESGGLAGTFSPNAAVVQAAVPVSSGSQYTVVLKWKANRSAAGVAIYAGAGPLSGQFSPTTLSVRFVPGAVTTGASTSQYHLTSSDGSTWTAIDSAKLSIPATAGCLAVVSANADLWTATPGYNQDMAISVTSLDAIAYPGGLVGWKESGGSAAYSPNAAYLQSIVGLPAGRSYTITLLWKTNRPAAGESIYAGAGALPSYSPSSLTVELSC